MFLGSKEIPSPVSAEIKTAGGVPGSGSVRTCRALRDVPMETGHCPLLVVLGGVRSRCQFDFFPLVLPQTRITTSVRSYCIWGYTQSSVYSTQTSQECSSPLAIFLSFLSSCPRTDVFATGNSSFSSSLLTTRSCTGRESFYNVCLGGGKKQIAAEEKGVTPCRVLV